MTLVPLHSLLAEVKDLCLVIRFFLYYEHNTPPPNFSIRTSLWCTNHIIVVCLSMLKRALAFVRRTHDNSDLGVTPLPVGRDPDLIEWERSVVV